MVVVVQHTTIINRSGGSVNVRPLSSDYSKLEAVPVVDSVVAYYCPHTLEKLIIVVRSGLYVHSMMNNFIPPFVIREAGLIVNCVPKINIERQKLTNNSHCIVSTVDGNVTDLRIPMQLDGILSYFLTQNLTQEEINKCE